MANPWPWPGPPARLPAPLSAPRFEAPRMLRCDVRRNGPKRHWGKAAFLMGALPMLHSSKGHDDTYKAGLRKEPAMTLYQLVMVLGFWASVLLATGLRFLMGA